MVLTMLKPPKDSLLRARPTLYFIVLAVVGLFFAFKFKVLMLPVAIIIAVIGLTYVYSRQRRTK
jgi:hypothetical protein